MARRHRRSPAPDRHDACPGPPNESAAILQRFLDGAADAVLVVDASGRCIAGNGAAAGLLGYGDGGWTALTLSALPAERTGVSAATAVPGWEPAHVRRADGALIAVDTWSTRISGFGDAASLVYVRIGATQAEHVGGPDGLPVIEVSPRGTITEWNHAAEQWYGFNRREVIGKSIAKLAPSDAIDDVATVMELIRRGDCTASFQTSQLTKDGRRFDVCFDISPVRDGESNVVSANVTVRSAVGQGRGEWELRKARASVQDANRALRVSEERFRGAFDGASIGMALVAPDGQFLLVNPALRAILLYDESEFLTQAFQDITHPVDRDADRELARQLLNGEIAHYQVEKRYLRKDGETIWGRLTMSLARDDARVPRYFVAQVQDITPYKAAGAALREAEARYRTLVEQIPAAVYVDAGESLGVPRYISPRIETLLGYSPHEWVADSELWVRAVHPDDRARVTAAVAAADSAAGPMHLEYRFLARDGREVWVHDQVAPVRDEHGAIRYWQGFMVDITDRKKAEVELRLAKEAAEEANRLKSAFLSMATHELRTPLTIMSGYVEMLAESVTGRLTVEEREFLAIAQTGTQTLAALVDDLLDLARMEAGRLDLTIRPVDVGEAIERVQRLVAAQAAGKGIGLEVTVAPGLPPVAADLNRLVQVLFNLLGNAIKFTEQGSVRTTVRADGDGIEFSVADTGIGIPPEALPRIFEEFRQADAGTTRRFGGSGLGLAIAKRLVELQGGALSVESEVGAGSTFRVWLPAAPLAIDDDAMVRPEQRAENIALGPG